MVRKTPEQKFFDKVTFSDGCCEWRDNLSDGYGQIRVGKVKVRAHRFSYELFYGPIPEGMCVLHSCDNRACIKPTHLILGTWDDNNKDRARKRRSAYGERAGNFKLRDKDLVDIAQSFEKRYVLAQRYGVAHGTICRIRRGTYVRPIPNV